MSKIFLTHYSPFHGVALIRVDGKVFRLDPPYGEIDKVPVDVSPEKNKKEIEFQDSHALSLYLNFKNSMYVASSIPGFIKKESLRPETVSSMEDLKELLCGIITSDLESGTLSGKCPFAIQFHQTVFGGDQFSKQVLMDNYPDITDWDPLEISDRAIIMSGHVRFDFTKWIVPSILEIEGSWIPMERFQEMKDWLFFVNKFMDLKLSKESEAALKRAYSKVGELARIQKFVKDGRHKVKDWQKSAPFIR